MKFLIYLRVIFLCVSANAEVVLGSVLRECVVVQLQLLVISDTEVHCTSAPVLENCADLLFVKCLILQ